MRINRSIISNFNPNDDVTFGNGITVTPLSGIGNRMVIANQNGTLATQAIPGGGGGSGTVTSVDMTVPTGFQIGGNPITTSGTLALSFASGYALPTTIKQGNWDDSYTFVAAFPSQTGQSGKFLTTNGSALSFATVPGLTDGDKGDITVSESGASWNIDAATIGLTELSATGTPSEANFLRGDNSWATPSGGGAYAMQFAVHSVANFTWADNVNYFIGLGHSLNIANVQGRGEVFVPKTGTIKAAYVYGSFSTAGSNETWSMSVLINGTTATTISNATVSGATRLWSNSNLAIAVTAGQHIEIRSNAVSWATNPASSAGFGINAILLIE